MISPAAAASPGSVDDVIAALAAENYVADRRLATAVFLRADAASARSSSKASRASARPSSPRRWRGRCRPTLLRVQCYEGLDVAQTAYEWNVARQMMEIRLAEAAHDVGDAASRERLAKSLYARDDADRAAAAAGADAGRARRCC